MHACITCTYMHSWAFLTKVAIDKCHPTLNMFISDLLSLQG